MRLLVAHDRCNCLIDDTNDACRKVLEQEGGFTFGATWDGEDFLIGQTKASADGKRREAWLLYCDLNFEVVKRELVPTESGPSPHQLHYNPADNKLYWCMASQGYVTVKDMAAGEWLEWRPLHEETKEFVARLDVPPLPRRDLIKDSKVIQYAREREFKHTHYVNAIWFEGDTCLLSSMNKGPSEIAVCKNGELVERIRTGQACHNVWREDGKTYYCDSGAGVVKTLEGDVLTKKSLYWIRGIACAGGRRYLGHSFRGRTKPERSDNTSYIQVMDMDWNTIKIIDIPWKGEIRDIRVLAADHTHNLLEPPL